MDIRREWKVHLQTLLWLLKAALGETKFNYTDLSM